MKIRFTNPFLALCGSFFAFLSMLGYQPLIHSFLFGACFGMIYLNYKEEKNGRK